MGFTGSKAARFKEAYIERFDMMEKHLQEQWLAGELEPLFDDAGLPRDRLETAKAQRRQMSQMKALLFRADPRLKQIVPGQSKGKTYPKVGVAPQVVNLPVKPRVRPLPPTQIDAHDPSGDLFA